MFINILTIYMLFKSNGKPTLWFTCTLDVLQEWIKNQTIFRKFWCYLYLTLNSEWILGQIHNLIKFTYSQLKLTTYPSTTISRRERSPLLNICLTRSWFRRIVFKILFNRTSYSSAITMWCRSRRRILMWHNKRDNSCSM